MLSWFWVNKFINGEVCPVEEMISVPVQGYKAEGAA